MKNTMTEKIRPRYFTVKEFALIFRRHPRTVRRWIAEEYIKAVKVRDGWLIPNTEEERIMHDQPE